MLGLLYDHIFPYQFTLQEDLNIYGQLIFSGEMICEGIFSPITINYHYYVSSRNLIKKHDFIFEDSYQWQC